jgi:hypothetical protein
LVTLALEADQRLHVVEVAVEQAELLQHHLRRTVLRHADALGLLQVLAIPAGDVELGVRPQNEDVRRAIVGL